jgi:hypothetical protein
MEKARSSKMMASYWNTICCHNKEDLEMNEMGLLAATM